MKVCLFLFSGKDHRPIRYQRAGPSRARGLPSRGYRRWFGQDGLQVFQEDVPLSRTKVTVPGGPEPSIVETWTYEPLYQSVKTFVSARGNAPGGNPAQFTTTLYYDYEEAALGDLNFDGITNQNEGNVVKRDFPAVTQPALQRRTDYIQWVPVTGRVSRYFDPGMMIVDYSHDPFFNVIGENRDSGGLNLTTTYVPNSVGLVKSITDPKGYNTQITLNELDQAVAVQGPAPSSYLTQHWYDVRGRYGKTERENKDGDHVLDPNNPWFTDHVHYNNFDRPTHRTREIDLTTVATTKNSYSLQGALVLQRSAEGNFTFIERDERELAFRKTAGYSSPDAAKTQYDYDLNGDPSVVTDPMNFQWNYLRDGFGRETRLTNPLTHYKQTTWDEEDNVTMSEVYDGFSGMVLKRTTTSWDEAGYPWESRRMFQTSGGMGNPDSVTTTWRNARCQTIQVRDPMNNDRFTNYDTAGRMISTVDAVNNRKEYDLDANGNAYAMRDVEWNPVTASFETYTRNGTYDERDFLVQSDEVDRLNPGNILKNTFKYNSLGFKVYRTDAMGDTVSWSCDGLRRHTRTVYDLRQGGVPVGTITTSTAFDRDSNVVSRTDDDLQTTTYGFNARDEMNLITYADATQKQIQRGRTPRFRVGNEMPGFPSIHVWIPHAEAWGCGSLSERQIVEICADSTSRN